ncbi:hypothetical protein [Microbulbifer litoralis]|uniref:hypothetical protein n=1 Tax=Microbulbifer litoralis TaxID=2933965 RepID=UPI002029782E|nr:hypothetical protein [Microbulbifer sp. GX H0434]
MTTAQKLYNAIEFFSVEEPYFEQFKKTFRDTLVAHGAPTPNAMEMTQIAAESLRQFSGDDYHLRMAEIIACDPAFERAIDGNAPAFHATHRYMSYYLELPAMPQIRVAN